MIAAILLGAVGLFLAIYILCAFKCPSEYERLVYFTLGRLKGTKGPGLCLIWPIFQSAERIDLRTRVMDIPSQKVVTQDGVTLTVNGVVYYKVGDPAKAVTQVEEYMYAVQQLALVTIKNITGKYPWGSVLAERDKIAQSIEQIVDKETDPWGIKVTNVELKEVDLPPDLERSLSAAAEAKKKAEANILISKSELEASKNYAEAAETLANSSGGMQLRTLQTLQGLGADPATKIIFPVPFQFTTILENLAGAIGTQAERKRAKPDAKDLDAKEEQAQDAKEEEAQPETPEA